MSNFISNSNKRINYLYVAIVVVFLIFITRLFYIQIIRNSYYQAQAQDNQLRRYSIPAERGAILASDGGESLPLVLNELRYNIVADPEIITDKEETALRVADVLQVSKDDVLSSLNEDSRYEILAKKQTKIVKDQIETLMTDGDIIGVFAEKTVHRVYPQGTLAAQLLGFVNDEGEGNYGIEQYLQEELSGRDGRVKALTDQNGIPLLANGDNVQEDAIDGQDVTLTIDIAMQRQLEQILKSGVENAISESGSAIIVDPNNGQIKAMANYPSFDPANFSAVEDPLLFTNAAVSSTLEPGSIMKTLTAAAAIDSGSVAANQSYYDPARYVIGDAVVTNIAEDGGAATRTVSDILRFSLNTGATWLLMQMGGGELNEQGRTAWNKYMVNQFQLGSKTGIEQGFEEAGYIPDPVDGFGLNIQYANTAFGQGMTATALQMTMAVASVVNGGTYFQPTLVAGTTDSEGNYNAKEPEVVVSQTVSSATSKNLVEFMQVIVAGNNSTSSVVRDGYIIGGKTGTAEIARPGGGYYEDRFNGTYVGFVGGDTPEYMIFVRINDPKIAGYAGSKAAAPVFVDLANMLIDNFSVQSASR